MNCPLSIPLILRFLSTIEDCTDTRPLRVGLIEVFESWRGLGLRSGELVLVAMPQGLPQIVHFFAILLAGGRPALVSSALPTARLIDLVRSLGARFLLTPTIVPVPGAGWQHLPLDGASVALIPGVLSARTEISEVVMLTSGTSGFASGCLFDFDALMLNAARHGTAIGLRPGDRILVSLPIHYSFALVAQVLAALVYDCQLVLCGAPFHAPTYLRRINEQGCTVSSLTPTLVRSVLHQQAPWPSCLRVLTIGGDTISTARVEELMRLRRDGELYITYGLTQAGPRVLTLAAHQEPVSRWASVGHPLPGTKIGLREHAVDRGELIVSSASLMKHRVGQVEGRHDDWHAPGVLRTGDEFTRDEDGYLYFTGRMSDFIVMNGEKVSLASVRRLAVSVPDVHSAQTRILDGGSGFLLNVLTDPSADPDDVRRLIFASLRRSEYPSVIQLTTDQNAWIGPK